MLPISGENLERLIPQKRPFVLVSTLQSIEGNSCTTTFRFEPDHVLCEDGVLSMAGLLENMAQSSGCKMGFEDYIQGKTPRVGFIGEVRDFTYSRLPLAGEELITEITIESQVFGSVSVIAGKVMLGHQEIASCRMKVFFETDSA